MQNTWKDFQKLWFQLKLQFYFQSHCRTSSPFVSVHCRFKKSFFSLNRKRSLGRLVYVLHEASKNLLSARSFLSDQLFFRARHILHAIKPRGITCKARSYLWFIHKTSYAIHWSFFHDLKSGRRKSNSQCLLSRWYKRNTLDFYFVLLKI